MTLAAPPAFARPLLLPPLTSTLSPSIAHQMKRHDNEPRLVTPLRTPFPYDAPSPNFASQQCLHERLALHDGSNYASPRLPPASWLLQQTEPVKAEVALYMAHPVPPPVFAYSPPPAVSPTHTDTEEVRGECLDSQCHQAVKHRGYCKLHGGARRCDVPGCPKGVQGGNLCIGHGGGKRCRFPGCSKATQSQGLCKAHGGGVRCKFDGCNKSSQGGGFCRRHGGGKRCSVDGCPRGAQRGSTCAQHGGKAKCMVDGCVRADRGGGYCEVHRKDKVCRQGYCNRLARIKCEGYCTQHHREYCIANGSPASR
ncbi:hypothetical protein ACHHYP_01486 [Achlya hypogyna]|uniref:WRKY19-like zinc finger domain-containing protein n=1 Tax=Achlya hypogyna TaxID=1202772 RepID=A0A1V9ZTZ5_ACHHY|nr:hypothetical protein ACHHYP_01486 [Achlya hypogyna]